MKISSVLFKVFLLVSFYSGFLYAGGVSWGPAGGSANAPFDQNALIVLFTVLMFIGIWFARKLPVMTQSLLLASTLTFYTYSYTLYAATESITINTKSGSTTYTDGNDLSITNNSGIELIITITPGSGSCPTGGCSFTIGASEQKNLTFPVTTLTHNGITYGTVTSPHTSRVWLDRNLGASQVCTALNDTACYGDYYQWGRDADGHEKSNSETTTTLANSITPANAQFIINGSSPDDWVSDGVDNDGSQRSANWSKTDGSSVCPVGYRVPTIDELTAETIDLTGEDDVQNNTDAFNSFLKLPSAGYRDGSSGSLDTQGSNGSVWSSSVYNSFSKGLGFGSSNADWYYFSRVNGLSVRCIKD